MAVALAVVIAAVGAGACVSPPPAEVAAPGDGLLNQEPVIDPRAYTVRIRATSCEGFGIGSGFLLDANTIITNRHVVEGSDTLEVETYEGDRLQVDVASQGTVADLAVVKIAEGIGKTAELAADDPAGGTVVRAYGYAGGGPMRVTEGRVKDYVVDDRLGNAGKVMRADLEIRPGNSGGPALDASGAVIGVVYAVEIQTKMGLIVPLSTLRKVLEDDSQLEDVEGC